MIDELAFQAQQTLLAGLPQAPLVDQSSVALLQFAFVQECTKQVQSLCFDKGVVADWDDWEGILDCLIENVSGVNGNCAQVAFLYLCSPNLLPPMCEPKNVKICICGYALPG